ncbi:HEAT repeat domain-containing protein [bacterium]|nr:HEAT repeat domain-containing protein [bacterium]
MIGPYGDGVLELDSGGTIAIVGRSRDAKTKIKDAVLVGRPAIAGSTVLLPLQGGLVKVDLAHDGRTEVFCDWKITGDRPANVACSQGRIVFAGVSRAVAFSENAEPASAVAFKDARAASRALAHRSFAVREAADAKLRELGSAAKDELAEAAGSADPEQRHRARAIQISIQREQLLAEWRPLVKDEWKVPGLLDRVTHPDPSVREKAVRELGAVVQPGVKELLTALLVHPDAHVGEAAAEALLAQKDRSGMALIARALRSASKVHRLNAVLALSRHGSEEDFALLERMLKDDEPEVRREALTGAIALGKDKAVEIATKALDDKDDKLRLDVVTRLASMKIGVDVAAPIFRKLMKDPLRAIRQIAIGSLKTMHHKEAFAAFGDALTDQDPTVQREAKEILLNVAPGDVALVPREAIEKALDQQGLQDPDRYHFLQLAETVLENGGPFSIGPLARAGRPWTSCTSA